MMNFGKAVAGDQWPVARKNQTFIPEAGSENWELPTDHWPLFLSCCPLLGGVPQAPAFDKTVEIFGQVGGVVPGALQGLRHQ